MLKTTYLPNIKFQTCFVWKYALEIVMILNNGEIKVNSGRISEFSNVNIHFFLAQIDQRIEKP